LVALARTIAGLYTNSEIDTLAYELTQEAAAVGPNKLSRALELVRTLETQCVAADSDRELVDLIHAVLQHALPRFSETGEMQGLLASLDVDGFAVDNGRLLATTGGAATLAPEISGLEADLEARGFRAALNNYRQAIDNLSLGNFEAANGQLRSFAEDVLINVCRASTDRRVADGGAALLHLRSQNRLDASEFSMCKGFWDASHTNGPHPGVSNPEEALFRLQVATAIGRYLIKKLTPRPAA